MNVIFKRDPVWLESLPNPHASPTLLLLLGGDGQQVAVPAPVLLAASPLVRSILTDLLPPAYGPCFLSLPAVTGEVLCVVVDILTTGEVVVGECEDNIEEVKEVFGMLGVDALLVSCHVESVPVGQVLDRELKVENSEETDFSLNEENKIKFEVIVKIEADGQIKEERQPKDQIMEERQPNDQIMEDRQPNDQIIEERQPNDQTMEERQPNNQIMEERQPSKGYDQISEESLPLQPSEQTIKKSRPLNIRDKTNKYCSNCEATFNTRILFIKHCQDLHKIRFKNKAGGPVVLNQASSCVASTQEVEKHQTYGQNRSITSDNFSMNSLNRGFVNFALIPSVPDTQQAPTSPLNVGLSTTTMIKATPKKQEAPDNGVPSLFFFYGESEVHP